MNLLKNETSPYLLQHKDNPVHWMPWGPAAFEKALAENKPILLSVGYSSCHWCHVMAHESFEDGNTAAVMNDNFINIKVDREEMPDVDMLYQQALSLMGKQGGWPLTMFLTPDRKPFWGGTYFPPQAKYGMQSFNDVLQGVARSYDVEGDKIVHNAKSLEDALKSLQDVIESTAVTQDIADKISEHYVSLIDPVNGGLGGAPKFPQLGVLNYLWGVFERTGQEKFKFAVMQSLAAMCQGGIYDHVGGGFHRYTVDAEWLVPHFEKMLYDNALFLSILARVYKATNHPLFRQRLLETADFMKKQMRIGDAFVTSFDADSEGIEGKHYIWREAEIDALLGEDSGFFKENYDVTKFGNWEGMVILNRLRLPEWQGDATEERLRKCLDKLIPAREKRAMPFRDDKILCDLNGLAITGFTAAAEALQDADLKETAEKAFHHVCDNLQTKDGKLLHAKETAGLLEDYAYMIEAALSLGHLAQARKWTGTLLANFEDKNHGGFFMTEKDTAFGLRLKSAHDNPLPSGNGVMAGNLQKLFEQTGDRQYDTAARKTFSAFAGAVRNNFFPYATLLAAQTTVKSGANDA